ncbi:GvpL/GvpF family gas vesicle protein [Acetobacteraceae bacterium H6797]|nr:GvpL/GvpF family gas vesicle protein [Acetobacteraceae bacterium H6797]
MSPSASEGQSLEVHALLPLDFRLPSRLAGLRLVPGRRIAALVGIDHAPEEETREEALARHREVCAAVSKLGACIPLPCGLVFPAAAPLHAWLSQRETAFERALEDVAGCEEWVVTLVENAQSHGAWLAARDPGLARMESGAVDKAKLGRLAAAQEAARQARRGVIAARVEGALSALSKAGSRERPAGQEGAGQAGRQSWSVLVPAESVMTLRLALAAEAKGLAGTGLLLDIAESLPAYRFARGVTHDA